MEGRIHGLVPNTCRITYLELKLKILSIIQCPNTNTNTMFINLLCLSVIWKLSASTSDILSVFEDLGEI